MKGYDDVVKKPMDFATISTKLSKGEYKKLEDFEVHPEAVITPHCLPSLEDLEESIFGFYFNCPAVLSPTLLFPIKVVHIYLPLLLIRINSEVRECASKGISCIFFTNCIEYDHGLKKAR